MPKINKLAYIYPLLLLVVLGLLIISSKSDQDLNGSKSSNTVSDGISTENGNIKYSLTEPASLWVIVNKHKSIPTSYVPELTVPSIKLRLSQSSELMKVSTQAQPQIEQLFNQASKEGVNLRLASGYRSATTQDVLYKSYVKEQGQVEADKFSARPGHSEHQTGLAIDIASNTDYCFLDPCWADTKEGKWLASNAYEFGFIIRYPKGKQSITGYDYEPWHLRYVGTELSNQVFNSNKTLEEFFGQKAAPNYL